MKQRLIWLVAIVACSGKPPPAQHAEAPPPVDAASVANSELDQDLPQLVERSLALYQAVGAALAPHGEAFDGAAQAIMKSPTLAKCAPDAGFTNAFDALIEPPP